MKTTQYYGAEKNILVSAVHSEAVAALDDDMVVESDTEARQKLMEALKQIATMTEGRA